jgi:exodeoxyribonuclease V alpha subunit
MDEGHCGLPVDELRELAAALLEIPTEVVDAATAQELAEGAVTADTVEGHPCLFLTGLHRAEQGIAERLIRLTGGRPPWPAIDPDKAIPWVERKIGMILAASQREAVRLALRAKVLVITGGPGVGKTTLVNAILEILRARTRGIALAAPTGRAAKRMREATGLEAKTLHWLLEADPARGGFKRHEAHPLDCELLVVDEVSMVDVPLLHSLLKAVPPAAGLILVGDVDQLPSVGPGQVLADIIASAVVPVVRLTEVFRQAAQNIGCFWRPAPAGIGILERLPQSLAKPALVSLRDRPLRDLADRRAHGRPEPAGPPAPPAAGSRRSTDRPGWWPWPWGNRRPG